MQREPGRRCYRACRTIEAPGRPASLVPSCARDDVCEEGSSVPLSAALDPAHFHARIEWMLVVSNELATIPKQDIG